MVLTRTPQALIYYNNFKLGSNQKLVDFIFFLILYAGMSNLTFYILKERLKSRIYIVISYFNILYFFEIISLMFSLLMFFGSSTAMIIGFTLGALLAVQIIGLLLKGGIFRNVQLYLMDIHFSYSLAYFINLYFIGASFNTISLMFIIIKIAIVCLELPFILLLTEDKSWRLA